METSDDGVEALPLWINGHAYLTMAETFLTVRDVSTGEAIRRVPLYGQAEAEICVAAAQAAIATWSDQGLAARRVCLQALAKAVDDFRGHFARLLMPETGLDFEAAGEEVDAAVAALRGAHVGEGGTLGLLLDAERPLLNVAQAMAPCLLGGATLVIKPSPKAPSAVFALCELASRHDWPAGVLNVLQGDGAAIEGLCRSELDRVAFAGTSPLREKIADLAARCERTLSVLS